MLSSSFSRARSTSICDILICSSCSYQFEGALQILLQMEGDLRSNENIHVPQMTVSESKTCHDLDSDFLRPPAYFSKIYVSNVLNLPTSSSITPEEEEEKILQLILNDDIMIQKLAQENMAPKSSHTRRPSLNMGILMSNLGAYARSRLDKFVEDRKKKAKVEEAHEEGTEMIPMNRYSMLSLDDEEKSIIDDSKHRI